MYHVACMLRGCQFESETIPPNDNGTGQCPVCENITSLVITHLPERENRPQVGIVPTTPPVEAEVSITKLCDIFFAGYWAGVRDIPVPLNDFIPNSYEAIALTYGHLIGDEVFKNGLEPIKLTAPKKSEGESDAIVF